MAACPRNEEREHRIHDDITADAHDAEEQAMGWYDYLEENLHFPFRAQSLTERRTSPLRIGDEVEVSGLAAEECAHDMFVLTHWKGRPLAVPLAQLAGIDVDEATRQAIEDWRYWVDRGYEF